ncbi:MAG: DUF5071 domain-containing protein [Bacteroidota bacterium]
MPKEYIKTELDILLETVDSSKKIQEQLDVFKQFDNISDEQIKEVTHDIKSFEAGMVVEYLGFERVKKYAPRFLEFLQDMNWPAARYVARMLIAAKENIIPEIQKVFKERDDNIWHYWIVIGIIKDWEPELVNLLKDDLLKLIEKARKVEGEKYTDTEYTAIESLVVLKEKGLLSDKESLFYYNYLKERFSESESLLKELNQQFLEN